MRLHSPLKRVKDYGVSMQKKNSHSPAQGGGALKLETAIERATSTKPPFLPALKGNEDATKLATLCRELQREAGDRPFICPVNVAQRFLNLLWPEQANWLLHQLERNGVIKCIDRGAPNKLGKEGKSTLWRYKLPLD